MEGAPRDEAAIPLPRAEVAEVLLDLLHVRKRSNCEAVQPVKSHEWSAGIVRNAIFVHELVSFDVAAAVARATAYLFVKI